MPYGTLVNRAPDTSRMDDWWKGRTIPRNRRGFGDILEGLGIISPMQLVLSSLGISLTDRYWIKPRGSDISWNDINPFGNTFPEDLGDIMFGLRDTSGDMDLRSPDSTCDGMLEKRWCIFDGNRCLVKGGNRPFSQEPYNEVIASRIANLLHPPCGLLPDVRERPTMLDMRQYDRYRYGAGLGLPCIIHHQEKE